jgi:hypothetical protein
LKEKKRTVGKGGWFLGNKRFFNGRRQQTVEKKKKKEYGTCVKLKHSRELDNK